ncbi:reverse transcriptase Ty1/copia-type domain-containing protein [Citrus sinensis]|nr:reverse transcriptase Ty1/copia-type domain-containing protein [Citrus sinensis]
MAVTGVVRVAAAAQYSPLRRRQRHRLQLSIATLSSTISPSLCHHSHHYQLQQSSAMSDNVKINSSSAPDLSCNVEDKTDNEVEEISVSTVNDKKKYISFREMMTHANHVVKPMSRNTLKSEILKLYQIEKVKTLHLLGKNHGRVAITTNLWTTSNQKKGYMVVTAHFIDNSWKLHSRILRFVYVPSPHTADALCNELVQCLLDWNVDRKLSSMTLDNCTTNDAMVEKLLLRWRTADNLAIRIMTDKMADKFDKYWNEIHPMLVVAVVLDPRYKMMLIHFYFPKIYGDTSDELIECAHKLCYDLVKEYESKAAHVSGGQNVGLEISHSESCSNSNKYWDVDEFETFRSQNKRAKVTKSELDRYLDEELLDSIPDFDILAFWKMHTSQYPILAELAKDILAIPVSIVASEFCPSPGFNFWHPVRSRVAPNPDRTWGFAKPSSRPDIAYGVGVVSRFMENPGKEHWNGVKWILRYLKGTSDHGILFGKVNGATCEVAGFVDLDFAGDLDKRISITGFVFTMCGGAISWKASLQSVVALSTTEAEYIALTEAVKKAIWLKGLVFELGFKQETVTISCDSSSAIQLSKNPKYHERTKHIDVMLHFIREEISSGVVSVVKIPSEVNPADMLTKPLPTIKFTSSLNSIGLGNM